MSSELMSVAQAAEFLQVSEITVKRFIRENLIQFEEKDGEPMLIKEAVERYKALTERFSKR